MTSSPKVLTVASAATLFPASLLKLSGTNPQGRSIGFTNYFMTQNGKPLIPVMGEFHFTRCAAALWEDELLKIKALGVGIVATYVFWNHVEQEESVFDWSGDHDLRRFVALCGKHDLDALVRIGPFAHGECRNGGIPDWLYGRPFALRSNDPRYLAYARRLYSEIARQLEGLLFKDGGPVIGIQLENEYMHAGAPWEVTFRQGTEYVPRGEDGAAHIAELKTLALDVGLDVPIYSVTGWLNSPILEDEVLPMQGGYVFTPWSPDPTYVQPPTREFLFRNRHQHPVLNGEPTYNALKYPYACCELGGGIQDTYFHRNIVPPAAVEGLALMSLAGGANLIGYYMVHGGTNPIGRHSYLNEFTVPRRSYDFQAPIREYGQFADSFRALRLLHSFLRDFGDLLALMTVTLPDNASAITPENTTDLRWAVRSNDGAGFIFLNNYQDHVEMQDIDGVRFELHTPYETLQIPAKTTLTLQKNVSAILPFGLSLSGIRLKYATTQLFAKIDHDYFFFTPPGMISEYSFDGQPVHTVTPGTDDTLALQNPDGQTVRIFTLTRDQAEHALKVTLLGKERMVISDGTLVPSGDGLSLYSTREAVSLSIFPPLEGALTTASGTFAQTSDGQFTRYDLTIPAKSVALALEPISPAKMVITLPADVLDGVDNVYLRVDYLGDIGNCFLDGVLVADNFYNGSVWEIGLKQILRGREGSAVELLILITPIRANTGAATFVPTGMAFNIDQGAAGVAEIRSISAAPQYKIPLYGA